MLRIAQIAPVANPVRPGSGDSIEHLVGLLCEELVRRGHDVTLYATGDSVTSARLRATRPHGYDADDELWDWQFSETVHAASAFADAADFDVIHAHDMHFALPFARLVDTPLVETQHVHASPEVRELQCRGPSIHLVTPSEHQRRCLGPGLDATVIAHGIDVPAFPFSPDTGEYLLFLGRMLDDKGPQDAVRIARATGMPIVLAGPLAEDQGWDPRSEADGEQVRYVGPVGHAARDALLAGAAALVFPVRYPEPFGLVMIEAMACGTPVLATRAGATTEIVDDGLSGYTAAGWQGLAALVPAALALDRARVRHQAASRFDVPAMVDGYEALYQRLAARSPV